MWIFTTKGFFSAVEDRERPGNMLVRFRDPEHARAFVAKAYAGRSGKRAQIRETPPPADYRWKVSVTRERFTDTVAAMAEEIDYNNFKAACHRQNPSPYPGSTTMTVWGAMNDHQQRIVRGPQRWRTPDPEPEPEDLFDYNPRRHDLCPTCMGLPPRECTVENPCPECGITF